MFRLCILVILSIGVITDIIIAIHILAIIVIIVIAFIIVIIILSYSLVIIFRVFETV